MINQCLILNVCVQSISMLLGFIDNVFFLQDDKRGMMVTYVLNYYKLV